MKQMICCFLLLLSSKTLAQDLALPFVSYGQDRSCDIEINCVIPDNCSKINKRVIKRRNCYMGTAIFGKTFKTKDPSCESSYRYDVRLAELEYNTNISVCKNMNSADIAVCRERRTHLEGECQKRAVSEQQELDSFMSRINSINTLTERVVQHQLINDEQAQILLDEGYPILSLQDVTYYGDQTVFSKLYTVVTGEKYEVRGELLRAYIDETPPSIFALPGLRDFINTDATIKLLGSAERKQVMINLMLDQGGIEQQVTDFTLSICSEYEQASPDLCDKSIADALRILQKKSSEKQLEE
jgi:hypothetical protein